MKVLFDHDIFQNYRYGGISRYIVELHKTLSHSTAVTSYLCAPFCGNEYVDEIEGDSSVIGNWKWPARLPKGKRFLREQILRGAGTLIQPDILHGTFFYRAKAPSFAKRFVITLHDMTNELLPQFFAADDPMPIHKRTAVENADHIICISERTRLDAMEIYRQPAEKFSVVHHGAISLPAASELPAELQKTDYLLFVGQRAGYKNFSALLSAFASSRRLRGDFVLVCCGGGPLTVAERATMTALALPDHAVKQFSGSDALLAALYKDAAALVYPSLYEGFGMPLLEAFSMGCPVVASLHGAIPEVAGNAVEYIGAASEEDMIQSIEAVVYDSDRAASLRTAGAARVAQFSWDKCATETIDAYHKAMAT